MSKPASVRQWSQPCITVVMWGRAVRSPTGTQDHRGRGGGAREVRRATATEGSSTGGAAGTSLRGRRAAGNGLPTLASPSLIGSAGKAVDAATLSFLTAQALEAKRMEEQESVTEAAGQSGQSGC